MKAPPIRDYREGGLSAYATDHADAARDLMDAVLAGLPLGLGQVARPFLPVADRISRRWLARAEDPYLADIDAIAASLRRPGAACFNLSYEWGCTSAAFPGEGPPTLMRVLDWPFDGIGERVELVRLPGAAGDWAAATWPGVTGILQAAAPGRFAAALNQAPERSGRMGRAADWVSGKTRFLRSRGWTPPHLLRNVFETAQSFQEARDRLSVKTVCAPVIFVLTGMSRDEACVIERLEDGHALITPGLEGRVAAANHFRRLEAQGRWRPRGVDSAERGATANGLQAAMAPDALTPPILNPLTRLAMTLNADGAVALCGYEGERRATGLLEAQL